MQSRPADLGLQLLEGTFTGWVPKVEEAPRRKISYEGTPRAIWYAVETTEAIFLAFIMIDYSGFAYDDSELTRALARFEVGDSIDLFRHEDGSLLPGLYRT